MMKKRGSSHIEFVTAFVLFIGFLLFVLFFFKPGQRTSIGDSTLKYTLNEIAKNATITVELYSVKIEPGAGGIPDTVAIDFPGIESEKKVRAEDLDGNRLPAKREGNTAKFDTNGKDRIKLVFSEDLEEFGTLTDASVVDDPALYTLAIADERKVLSEKRLLELNASYGSDYANLKKNLNLPESVNFRFIASLSDSLIVQNAGYEKGGEVYADKVRKETLRTDGKIEYGELVVEIW